MTELVKCRHCGEEFKKAGIGPHEKHCEDMKKREKRPYNRRSTFNAANAPARPNGNLPAEQVIIATIKQTVQRQSIRSAVPIDYVDCPHCEGVLVIGENQVDHISDLRTFLGAVAKQLQTPVEPATYHEVREPAESHGTEERAGQ